MGYDGVWDSIFFIYYVVYEEKKYIYIFLNEVVVLVLVLNEIKYFFVLYIFEWIWQRWLVCLVVIIEQDMNDWFVLFSLFCCESWKVQGCLFLQVIWFIICKGDIFVSEFSLDLEVYEYFLFCDQMFWWQMGGYLWMVEVNSQGVVWGIGYDYMVWVYIGGYGGGCF